MILEENIDILWYVLLKYNKMLYCSTKKNVTIMYKNRKEVDTKEKGGKNKDETKYKK